MGKSRSGLPLTKRHPWVGRLLHLTPQVSYRRSPVEGDPHLVHHLRGGAAGRISQYRSFAVVLFDADLPATTRVACRNATPDTLFEVGSLSKLLTVELYRRSADQVPPGTRLGELLDVAGSPVSDVTLEELERHESGLGTWGDDARDPRLGLRDFLNGGTPHADTSYAELLDRARCDPLYTRGEFSYSNIGIALLGEALAAAAGKSFPELLAAEVTGPLGMPATVVQEAGHPLTRRGVRGSGREVVEWPLGAYAPAGGVVSSARDMATFARHLLATTRLEDLPAEGVHRGLPLDDAPGRLVKIGATGGFTSVIALDLHTRTGAVVLTDTALRADDLARKVLDCPVTV